LLPSRRHLKQNRSLFLPKQGSSGKEVISFLLGVFKPFEMRNGLPALQSKPKRIRYLLSPGLNRLVSRHLPKRVVHFYGGESLGVVTEHLLLGKLLRVENPLPL